MREEESSNTLLIPFRSHDDGIYEGGGHSTRDGGFMEECKKQLGLALPLIAVSILQYCLQIISVMFVGHLGELPLASASMATSFASVTGFSVLLGMGSALETLCGQAYGAKQCHMIGIYTQRAIIVLLALSAGLAFLWFYTNSILVSLGQDKEISEGAGEFNRWMIPGLFAYGILQCLTRFLQAQSIVVPMMISSGMTDLLHIFLCWFLLYKIGLGSKGAALANAISYWINVLLLALYIKFSTAFSKSFTGFTREALHDLLGFLRLAIPSAVMICLEYWSFEMVVLLSGLLPNPKLETSVLSISLNTCWMVYMISVGLGGAVSTRVSNELGAGRQQHARRAVLVASAIATSEGIIVGTTTILVRNIWGKLYSNEAEVIGYVARIMPLLALSNFLDGFQCVLSGAARGCGWQNLCAVINLGAYYVVGIPSALLLAFFFHIGGMKHPQAPLRFEYLQRRPLTFEKHLVLLNVFEALGSVSIIIQAVQEASVIRPNLSNVDVIILFWLKFNHVSSEASKIYIWMGIICGLCVQAVALITVNLYANWDNEVMKVTGRVHAQIGS